jgi:hypothetical protein
MIAERDRAITGRDQAVDERDRAVGERDRAVGERDRAVGERDRAIARREHSPAPSPPVLPAQVSVQPRPMQGRHRSMLYRDIGWVPRLIAIAVLVVALVALLVVSRLL